MLRFIKLCDRFKFLKLLVNQLIAKSVVCGFCIAIEAQRSLGFLEIKTVRYSCNFQNSFRHTHTSTRLIFNRNCGDSGIQQKQPKNATGMKIITMGLTLYGKYDPLMKPTRMPEEHAIWMNELS